ncbi:unnamed protein product [Nippostrongylus brasiliensis]|uniref:Metallophosphoesterase 1 homolog (inferred by orthology to a C. elegans protein) n=1 Tax=Nippostrongylus brasiliensis TaxID=27835 RepID=A0A0N4Y836_NIPBR|nr:unnamed protein product [Nippostrongylus brasiliensis]
MFNIPKTVATYWPLFLTLNVVFFNEYLIYFAKIGFTCDWPCDENSCISNALRVFLIADTHLLGDLRGHWFDKLRREWQMYRSYRSALHLLSPDAVFFLGDLMDEGDHSDWTSFNKYANRFDSLFGSSSGHPKVHVLAGNHDLGFHYAVSPFRVGWFNSRFNRSLVDVVTIKEQPFILVTSMALHGDGCRFCQEAESQISAISKELNCAKLGNCSNITSRFEPYRKPIILQHFPLYRPNDKECLRDEDFDDKDPHRDEAYRPQWEALSEEATDMLLRKLDPRAVRVGVCHLPHESTVIGLYWVLSIVLLIWVLRFVVIELWSKMFRRFRRTSSHSHFLDKLLKSERNGLKFSALTARFPTWISCVGGPASVLAGRPVFLSMFVVRSASIHPPAGHLCLKFSRALRVHTLVYLLLARMLRFAAIQALY